MLRRLWQFLLAAGLVAIVFLAVRRTLSLRAEALCPVASPDPWPPLAEPEPPGRTPAWMEPVDGACPATHVIKAKLASGIYHVPGLLNYERTKPDRCYATEEAATADGFARAKR